MARRSLALATGLAALALVGCGLGPGPSLGGGAELDVTRDFGHRLLVEPARVTHVHQSDTVMRFVEATHKVTTRYGGGFVQSIDGLSGNRSAERDWFFYVNGLESSVGAADFGLSAGDRVQWDYHDWRAAMRVPAIVGAYPEPLVHGFRGRRLPVRVECENAGSPACRDAIGRLQHDGVVATGAALASVAGKQVARGLVARWSAIRKLQAAAPLEGDPASSSVFARFAGPGAGRIELLSPTGSVARVAPPGTGLVAARVPEGQGVVWLVTGVDEAGVERAAASLSRDTLKYAFAVAATPRGSVRLPVVPGG